MSTMVMPDPPLFTNLVFYFLFRKDNRKQACFQLSQTECSAYIQHVEECPD